MLNFTKKKLAQFYRKVLLWWSCYHHFKVKNDHPYHWVDWKSSQIIFSQLVTTLIGQQHLWFWYITISFIFFNDWSTNLMKYNDCIGYWNHIILLTTSIALQTEVGLYKYCLYNLLIYWSYWFIDNFFIFHSVIFFPFCCVIKQ